MPFDPRQNPGMAALFQGMRDKFGNPIQQQNPLDPDQQKAAQMAALQQMSAQQSAPSPVPDSSSNRSPQDDIADQEAARLKASQVSPGYKPPANPIPDPEEIKRRALLQQQQG